MKNLFNTTARHTVTEANINFYATPFIHPQRRMKEHDFIYMVDGEWKIGQSGEVFELKKDHLLILGAGEEHYGVSECTSGTRTMYFHVSSEEGDLTFDVCDDPAVIDSLTEVSSNKNIKKIFYEIVNAKLAQDGGKASILFDLLLHELYLTKKASAEILGERIKSIIHRNPEKFYSNRELAKLVNVSLKTAETKFKAQFGLTIHRYILNFKLEQSISLIKNFPEMQIKEISYNLGFYDEYHFSKQFKSYTGLSPTEYKKRLL